MYRTRKPQALDQLIADGSVDTLYLPVHVNGNHWTLLRLDLVSRQYAYGDSLNASAVVPKNVLDILVWWLDAIQPGQSKSAFKLSPQSLQIPRQNDGFSCGIIVLSTIAAILLDFSSWTQDSHAIQ
jgi:Ulp1 family protease